MLSVRVADVDPWDGQQLACDVVVCPRYGERVFPREWTVYSSMLFIWKMTFTKAGSVDDVNTVV